VIVDLCDCVEDLDNKAWIPIIRDCHNQLEECFNRQRIVYPGAPGGRFGPKPGNPFFPEPRPPRRRRPPF